MKCAWDHTIGKSVTVFEFTERHGPRMDTMGNRNTRPTLYCLVCKTPLNPMGESSPRRAAAWRHYANPRTSCPLKTGVAKTYYLPVPRFPSGQGHRLREAFFRNWHQHWSRVCEIYPDTNIDKLVAFIKEADQTSFWEHQGLHEWLIPYIFLVTCDFSALVNKDTPTPPESVRFILDSRVRTIEDLWVPAARPFALTRLTYGAVIRGANTGALVRQEPVKLVDDAFLRSRAALPKISTMVAMAKAFPASFA